MKNTLPKPVCLIILDGWGAEDASSPSEFDAIKKAHKPNWDKLWQEYPHTLLDASGTVVGLPNEQMGNSEVGHLTLGSGRIIPQELTRITDDMASGAFAEQAVLKESFAKLAQNQQALHIFGLLSPGGVHSHEDHLFSTIKLAHQYNIKSIYLHAFLDGRDTPPKSALASIEIAEALFKALGTGQIATISGRYFAMDRDNRWERVEKAYRAIQDGQAEYKYETAKEALLAAYDRNETDEFVTPSCITQANQPILIHPNDTILYLNFRADRARALTTAFTAPDFTFFKRSLMPNQIDFVTLTEYQKNSPTKTIYPPNKHTALLGQVLQDNGLTQLRIAETEKYAHVTFFFNGGVEKPYIGEERIMIPSPKVATYDLKPEMSAHEVTEGVVKHILAQTYDVIICNFANADMVGHTGNLPAAIQAVETLDACLGKIVSALQEVQACTLITADHGNAECMQDPITHQPHTAHTLSLVPCLYVGPRAAQMGQDGKIGSLADIAPTLLTILNLPIPKEMTGKNLITWI
jgi:2,3-bisphosphoglycerate-independent phosphoglycerate mutase